MVAGLILPPPTVLSKSGTNTVMVSVAEQPLALVTVIETLVSSVIEVVVSELLFRMSPPLGGLPPIKKL